MRVYIAAAMALALPSVTSAAQATDVPAGGLTAAEVAKWLQGEGYRAQLETATLKDGTKVQYVSSSTSGINFSVWVYDCKDNRCTTMQISAGWSTQGKFDTTRMNEWNQDHRWGQGYFDDSKDPHIKFDVDLSPGGTYEMLNDELSIWNTIVANFRKLYGL